jgi:hypothetical protein
LVALLQGTERRYAEFIYVPVLLLAVKIIYALIAFLYQPHENKLVLWWKSSAFGKSFFVCVI